MTRKHLSNRQLSLFRYNFPKELRHISERSKLLLPPKRHENDLRCLVIDGMNIAYQAYYAYKRLSHKGHNTSVLFGFANILRPLLIEMEPSKIVVCWDGPKDPNRLKLLPQYKGHREKNRDTHERGLFFKQLHHVRRLLYYMGVPQIYNDDMEGDDVICKITQKLQLLYRVTIVSADKDFKQLINYNVDLYNPRTKYIENVFAFTVNNWGIEIPQYVDFLCLVGDSSDDIPGYPNIGEKRASSFLSNFYSVKDYLNSNRDYPGLMDRDRLVKIIKRNRKLIDLQYFNRKFNKLKVLQYVKGKKSPKLNAQKYQLYCLRFGLKTMTSDRFLEPFKKLSNE